ncbi:hypothetical protein C8R44DRAFT_877587 [Mycena epipterygia]|nr:hypothetical protein C8R44DRAFT_877587 [Mycena epipterygia]
MDPISAVSKRDKSTPELGAYHPNALFPTNTKVPADNVAVVDALINFLNTLDPNHSESAAPKNHYSNTSVFWPTWQTPFVDVSSSLLAFSDSAVVNVTADIFRAEQIQFRLDLRVNVVGL